jgi:hypothetical protein
MKMNLKVIIALVLILVVSFVALDSVRTRAYNGDNLTFNVEGGPITVTNPSDQPVAVLLTSPETRAFSVASDVEGIAGTSAREGTGREAVHILAFELPPGISEFSVTRGRSVSFAAVPSSGLEAAVQPATAGTARTTVIAAVLFIIAALYYISRTTEHHWLSVLRGQVDTDAITRKSDERAAFKRILGRTTNSD